MKKSVMLGFTAVVCLFIVSQGPVAVGSDEVVVYGYDQYVRAYDGNRTGSANMDPTILLGSFRLFDAADFLASGKLLVGDVNPANPGDEVVVYGYDQFIRVYDGTETAFAEPILLDYFALLGIADTGDVNIAIGDVNANPGDELVVSGIEDINDPAAVIFIVVYAGTHDPLSPSWGLPLDQFRLFGSPDTNNVNITIGDVNANPGDELVVTGEDQFIRVYDGTGAGYPTFSSLEPILLSYFHDAGDFVGAKVAVGNVTVREASAVIDLDPDTLNLKSKGKYVTAYVYDEDGAPLSVASADIVAIDGAGITPISEERTDGNMVKFLRSALIDNLRGNPLDASDDLLGEVDISIEGEPSGSVFDVFEGTATIRVIDGNRKGN